MHQSGTLFARRNSPSNPPHPHPYPPNLPLTCTHPVQCLTLSGTNNIKLRATNKHFYQGSVCREECNLMLHVYPGHVSLKGPVS